MMRTADTPAQLIQLGETEAVGAVDDDGVGVGNVDAGLDDGGAYQHVKTMVIEIRHHPFQVALAHLSVGHRHPCLGNQRLEFARLFFDGLHIVVQEEQLTAAADFTQAGLLDHGLAAAPVRWR